SAPLIGRGSPPMSVLSDPAEFVGLPIRNCLAGPTRKFLASLSELSAEFPVATSANNSPVVRIVACVSAYCMWDDFVRFRTIWLAVRLVVKPNSAQWTVGLLFCYCSIKCYLSHLFI